jgi:hypothetical protein
MLAAKTTTEKTGVFSFKRKNISSSPELKFITQLGRNLLFTVHPKKVACRVAEAIQSEVEAEVCAVIVELESVGFVSCAYDADCEEKTDDFLQKTTLKKCFDILPPQVSMWTEEETKFLLKADSHKFEYVSPLHINGEVKGAIIAGFSSASAFTERTERIIDAAAQVAAMSINLTAHYESTIDTSISQARLEHRRCSRYDG